MSRQYLTQNDRENIANGQKLADDVAKFINTGNKVAIDAFTDKMLNYTHRTLQQGFGNLIIEVINRASEKYHKGFYDARNEAFYQWCSDVTYRIDCEYRRFPCI